MKNLFTGLALLFFSLTALAANPNDLIQGAADELAAKIGDRRDELASKPTELYALIDTILLPRFDRRYAAQLVLGRHWREASADQRERFIEAFYGSLLRRYADGVLKFDQKMIAIDPFRGDENAERTTVKTTVTLDDGTSVPVNYGLVRRDGGWMIFDVTIEGISYVRNYRTELNSEIQATGLDAVIKRLESEASSD